MSREVRKTITEILERDLCTGCGTCVGLCPNDAVKLRMDNKGLYKPVLYESKCTQCGLCIDVCPGNSENSNKLNKFVFARTPQNIFLGNFISCYIGYSTDKRVRREASSGGLITSLLIFALEEGIIDGAIVTRMNERVPLKPEVFIARTKEEIVSASRSKYCPVPVNVAIKDVLRNQEGKYSVVGLPCHIHGVRKAEMTNKKLSERIVLHLGLMCSHTTSFFGTKLLLQKLNIHESDVIKISYRGGGWPGGMTIKLRGGCKVFVPLFHYWDSIFGPFFFTPMRCTLCNDATNELADISFGDAWLQELRGNNVGWSLIITRTKRGEEILREAEIKSKIRVVQIDYEEVLRSQGAVLRFKKIGLGARISFLKLFGKNIPSGNSKLLKPGFISYLGAPLPFLNIYVSSKPKLQNLLKYIPFSLLKMYHKCLYAFLNLPRIHAQ